MSNIYIIKTLHFVPDVSAEHSLSRRKILLKYMYVSSESKEIKIDFTLYNYLLESKGNLLNVLINT